VMERSVDMRHWITAPIAGLVSTVCLLGPTVAAIGSANKNSSSVGPAGIDALRLHEPPYDLLGRKIAIGQVEIGRPGQFGIDKAVSRIPTLDVTRVFFRDGQVRSSTHLDAHAQNVASIMISPIKGFRGVAPEARLYASAVGAMRRSGQPEECLATQHVAQQNSGDLRAINFSFGESLLRDPRPDAKLDGNALLTQCIDWSARVHDVLYVVAGNQGRGGISIPTDNFNGINVAFSRRVEDRFTKVDFSNIGDPDTGIANRIIGLESNIDQRRSIGLLAPGNQVLVLDPGGNTYESSGTSFAAPHVTATVALIQEFGDRQLRTNQPNWSTDSRRAEVSKAILLNSADKLQDQGNGLKLNMSRTVLTKQNSTWLSSKAYRDPEVPLDTQMGSGHLNAYRAYQQLRGGQWSPERPVAAIGWDYRQIGIGGSPETRAYRDYILDQPLKAGSFMSVTLTWNRRVELVDRNNNQEYDLGEDFRDLGLNNLDLYLMRAEDDDTSQSIGSSVSKIDSTEHLFVQISEAGRYKIRVVYHQQANEPMQAYGLAWWTVPDAP